MLVSLETFHFWATLLLSPALSSTLLLSQILLMLLLSTNYIPVVVNHILMAFYTGKVPFNCKVIITWSIMWHRVLKMKYKLCLKMKHKPTN